MKVDVLSRKGKGKDKKGSKKGKESHSGKVTEIRKFNTRDSMVSAETVENTPQSCGLLVQTTT